MAGGSRPVTAKATSKEGGRETFAAFDETHLFVLPELHRLHDTIRRNLGTKRKESEPWSLEVSTMYAPGEDSVAERSHAFAQAVAEGKIRDPGFLFDHRGGAGRVRLRRRRTAPGRARRSLRGGVSWIDLDRLVAEARDPQTEESDFRRYFLNRAHRARGWPVRQVLHVEQPRRGRARDPGRRARLSRRRRIEDLRYHGCRLGGTARRRDGRRRCLRIQRPGACRPPRPA